MPLESNKTKISLRLFDGDLERLRLYYPSHPYNAVIRQLVHNHLNRLDRARSARPASSAHLPEPTLELEAEPSSSPTTKEPL